MKIHVLILALVQATVLAEDKDGVAFFEANIRPLLAERCYECHSSEKGQSKGGLTLDTRDGWVKGGNTGAAIVPGKVNDSLLLKAVHYADTDLAMQPKRKGGKLPPEAIAKLEQWVAMGAPDPRGGTVKKLTGLSPEARAHWAFKAPVASRPPLTKHTAWARTWVDSFVLAKLEAAGLQPATAAAPDALLRRMFYDMLGLPPTVEQIANFTREWQAAGENPTKRSAAIERVVDLLLGSPHYGERWARHWLDTARYSDTRGLVSTSGKFRFEDYRYKDAWTYRDYVISTMNEDKPYDQFIIEQLAADKLPDIRADDDRLAALGFITSGRKFNNPNDVIDEQIDATTKAFLGLTVSCARCHDHKFDPIPIADYYSLHGVFASTEETYQKPVLKNHASPADIADYEAKLTELERRNREHYYDLLQSFVERFAREAEARVRLHALVVHPGFQSAEAFDLKERMGIVHFPQLDLQITRDITHPVWGPLNRLASIERDTPGKFKENGPELLKKAQADARLNPLIARALEQVKGVSMDEICDAYVQVFQQALPAFSALLQASREDKPAPLEPPLAEVAASIWPMPRISEIRTTEQLMAVYQRLALTGGDVDDFQFLSINELRLTHPGAPACAMICRDIAAPRDSRVFIRGDEHKLGDSAPRQFLECLSAGTREPFRDGSGRLQLAREIANKTNPLTARVAVNRAWMHHFGEGFVRTPDDLGNMSEKPSHPELLDTLAVWFMENGWSLKKLHKLILLSAAYQQSANPSDNHASVHATVTDADNRLLWRANLRRLDFESIRDSLLLLTGKLDHTIGGKPANITDEPFSHRRSIYGYVDRLFLSDLPTQFDFADPMLPTSRRISTIVPQQALYFMNNPLTVDVARSVVTRPDVALAKNDSEKITALYRILFQRAPSADEARYAAAFLARTVKLPAPKLKVVATKSPKLTGLAAKAAMLQNEGERIERRPLSPWELLVQAMICANEFVYVN